MPSRLFSGTAKSEDDKLFDTVRAVPLPMSKVIHCIRHGQGYHNVAGESNYALYKSYDYEDAHLTSLGWQQMDVDGALNGNGAGNGPTNGATGLLMAPLPANPSRCRETPGHPGVSLAGVPPMIAREEAREHYGMHPCDKRRPISEHKLEFPGVDFSGIADDDDVLWTPEARESEASISARARSLIAWIMRRKERHVAIVAHAGFLRALSKQLEGDSMRFNHRASVDCFQLTLENCGLRSYVLSNFKEGPIASGSDGLTFQGGPGAAKDL